MTTYLLMYYTKLYIVFAGQNISAEFISTDIKDIINKENHSYIGVKLMSSFIIGRDYNVIVPGQLYYKSG